MGPNTAKTGNQLSLFDASIGEMERISVELEQLIADATRIAQRVFGDAPETPTGPQGRDAVHAGGQAAVLMMRISEASVRTQTLRRVLARLESL